MKQWTIALASASVTICMVALLLIATVFAMREQVTGEVDRVSEQLSKEFGEIQSVAEQAMELAFSADQEVAAGSEERTNASTVLKISTYDVSGTLLETEDTVLPVYLMNLDREQVESFFDGIYEEYRETSGIYEITGAKLLNFSTEVVEIAKTAEPKAEGFYVHALNDSIVVYYADKETIFDATGIPLEHLSEQEQIRLRHGIYVETQEDLFSLLEAYTS